MATSRTGTALWKRLAQQAKQEAFANGQTRCPLCRTHLDYETPRRPNSAEADHITPAALGGQDTPENIRIICRKCNQKLGGKLGKALTAPKPTTTTHLPTRIDW